MSNNNEIDRSELDLQDNPEVISPPIVKSPLYACATAVTVIGFIPHAELELEIDGGTLPPKDGGFPDPHGFTFRDLDPLEAGWVVRARQHVDGVASEWSPEVIVRDHLEDYPAGPPRPEINPAPVYECGARTGVTNLLIGCNVWITADATEVGNVKGAEEHQGVNVSPDYGYDQRVRAYAELCEDQSPPSLEHRTQHPPDPLPTPAIEDIFQEGERMLIRNLVNGARFTVERGGSPYGTYRTWGGRHKIGVHPPFVAGETFAVKQRMCPSAPESEGGETTVLPCSDLPAPVVAPIQVGDTWVTVTEFVAGARIKVFANLEKIGDGGGSVIWLTRPVGRGEVVYVLQEVGDCTGSTVRVVHPLCVAPHVSSNPAGLNLFPVGQWEYEDGDVKGSVYYPAEDDGDRQPFHRRLAELGPVPIVFMAHGNHATHYNPADRFDERSPSCGHDVTGFPELPSYQGYNYFQEHLARMGIIAVSVDCNATNGCISNSRANIEWRAELIMASIDFFRTLSESGDEIFGERIDFSKVGLMGHSRGGEAVVLAGNQVPATLGVEIRAVISLAPVNHDLWVPEGYAFMTILPAADGDVWTNCGAKFYDKTEPAPLKSQLYVDFANHNFFNREWVSDEDGRPSSDLLARGEQERILSQYGCALFRAFLLEHNTTGFLTYRALPPGIDTDNVHLSFERVDQLTVDHHEDGNGIGLNSLGEPTTQSGVSADEYTLQQSSGIPTPSPYSPNTFWGATVGMVVECEQQWGFFRSQLDGEYALTDPRYEIWIRAAEVSNGGSNPPDATGFELGLEDKESLRAWADSDSVGGLPRPFDRPGGNGTKTMFTTLRFPIRCFHPEEEGAEFAFDAVCAILVRCNREDRRPLAFDVLQIVSE